MRIASIGECMIELRQMPGGHLTRSFGGDTLNTAVYLARLGASVDYVTAMGDDPLSDEMIAGWRDEGIGIERVLRLKGKLPGLYMIETNTAGERRFYHWRDASAVRGLMSLPETEALLKKFATCDDRIVAESCEVALDIMESERSGAFVPLGQIEPQSVTAA